MHAGLGKITYWNFTLLHYEKKTITLTESPIERASGDFRFLLLLSLNYLGI